MFKTASETERNKEGKSFKTLPGLISLVQRFYEAGSLFDRHRKGATRLSEAPTSTVA